MTYDDDPYNEDEGRPRRYLVVAVIVFALCVVGLLWFVSRAHAQDYLPPQRYRTPQAQDRRDEPEEPQQYYANDWIVYAPNGQVMCKDPYIELDLKTIRCIATEKWR